MHCTVSLNWTEVCWVWNKNVFFLRKQKPSALIYLSFIVLLLIWKCQTVWMKLSYRTVTIIHTSTWRVLLALLASMLLAAAAGSVHLQRFLSISFTWLSASECLTPIKTSGVSRSSRLISVESAPPSHCHNLATDKPNSDGSVCAATEVNCGWD